MKKKGILACVLVTLLLLIDQIIKVEVKLNMQLGDEIYIFDWFRIHFIENNGMAWGMELGSKLFLSLFRIIAVIVGCWYIATQIRRGARTKYIVLLSMILCWRCRQHLRLIVLWTGVHRIHSVGNRNMHFLRRWLCTDVVGKSCRYVLFPHY